MKNNRLIRCIVPLTLAVLAAVLFAGCNGGYRSIAVASVSGGVSVSREGQSGEISCYEGMKLQDQDVVSVDDDGCVILKLDDDKFVYLEPGAQIQISASGKTDSAQTDIKLLGGTMSAVIEQKLDANESFSVTVDNVSMVVRGTIFRISRGEDENGEPTVTVQTVEGTVGINTGDDAEQALGASFQDVILLTDTGGTFTSVDTPIDYTALPPQTLDWIRGALQDKLDASTDPNEIESLQEILAIMEAVPSEAALSEAAPTDAAGTSLPVTPEATPTSIPTPTPTPEPKYSLTLRKSCYGKVSVKEGHYPAGAEIPISVEPNEGFEFNGWMMNGASAPALGMSSDIVFVMPNSETMIAARFKKTKYLLSIHQPALGGAIAGKAGRYAKEDQIALTATASAGYVLTGWLVNGSVSPALGAAGSVSYHMPGYDAAISAVFTKAYTLSITQPAQGGTISGTGGLYVSGTEIALNVVPSAGYVFTGWVVNGSVSAELGTNLSITYHMPSADTILSAEFTQTTHTLSFEQPQQGGGTIGMTAGQYALNDIVSISVAPDVGKTLACLVINGVPDSSYQGQTSIRFTMPDEDVLISAVFQ